MMVIVAGVMIGLCLAIMEQGARKAGKHKKGRCMDRQPKVKVGDRVRIIKDTSYGQTGNTGEVRGIEENGYGFDFRTHGTCLCSWMSKDCDDEWEILQPTKEQTMTQQTFKVGDRVKLMRDISNHHYYSIANVGMIGRVADKENPNGLIKIAWDNLGGRQYFVYARDLDLSPKTLNDLTEGDVVVDKDDTDDTMTVAHVLKPGLYVMADDEEEPQLYTATKLKNLDYVPQPDPEDDKTWLTVAEVAKKLGLKPDKLHIVADKKAA